MTSETATKSAFVRRIVDTFPDERLTYQQGIATFHPESAQDASKFLQMASTEGQKIYITGFGNNIDPTGPAFENLLVIRTDRLGTLYSVDRDSWTITVGSGFPLRELNRLLEEDGLFFPLGNTPYVGSIGGCISTNLTARLDQRHWQSKEGLDGSKSEPEIDMARYLLAMEIVTGDGKVKSLGTTEKESQTRENFARIMAGAWGQFGLIVTATLRVLPLTSLDEYHGLLQREIIPPEVRLRESAGSEYFTKLKRAFDPKNILVLPE